MRVDTRFLKLVGRTITKVEWIPPHRRPDRLMLTLDDGSTATVYAMYRLNPEPDYHIIMELREGEENG